MASRSLPDSPIHYSLLALAFALAYVVFSIVLVLVELALASVFALALVLVGALMSLSCGVAASDQLVSMMSLVFMDQRVHVETTGILHEAVQGDDVLHTSLRKSRFLRFSRCGLDQYDMRVDHAAERQPCKSSDTRHPSVWLVHPLQPSPSVSFH